MRSGRLSWEGRELTLLRRSPATVVPPCEGVKTRAPIPYEELTGMGTSVRDGSGLGLRALPPSPRPRQRHRSALGRLRTPVCRPGGGARAYALLADGEPDKYERAAARWHLRFAQEVPHVDLRESLAVLALLVAIPANRLAASALAELLSRRRSCERIAEALVRWSRAA